ncbi:hypothetical protein GJ496_002419 [Pomphorhynchus laevis]|nr:hypothetical protein GJ496_002419 [Pomphorhynchus laevis]
MDLATGHILAVNSNALLNQPKLFKQTQAVLKYACPMAAKHFYKFSSALSTNIERNVSNHMPTTPEENTASQTVIDNIHPINNDEGGTTNEANERQIFNEDNEQQSVFVAKETPFNGTI